MSALRPREPISALRAVKVQSKPPTAKRSRASNSACAAGLAYERAVRRALPAEFVHNPWFQYTDTFGTAWCSPDFWRSPAERGGRALILEVKLTYTREAVDQLLGWYMPIGTFLTGVAPRAVIVVKNVVPGLPREQVFSSLREAEQSEEAFPVVHWLGTGTL